MKLRSIFLFTVLTVLALYACKKSSDSSSQAVDYGALASGTYTGTVQLLKSGAEVVISKQSTTAVNIDFTITGGSPRHYTDVVAGDGGGGKILLSLTTGPTPINGTVNGKSLDCYFDQVHFTGTKP